METLDLDINNYEYQDILNLFKLNIDFGENDLKNAKKQLLNMHPDKSGLDKKYFLFFSSAYKTLFKIYEFREKAKISDKKDINYENTEYMDINDSYNKELIENLKKKDALNPEKFNKWFNELFDKVKISTDYDDGGYGDWLKNNNSTEEYKINNIGDMNKAIEEKKAILRKNAIISHKSISEYNNNNYCDLTNSGVESYSSSMFSNLQYEDLKKAHSESVIPVTEEDYKPTYNNLEQANIIRKSQNLTPLSEKEAKEHLNNNKKEENVINSHRAYKLIKQEEDIEKANKLWWSSLNRLK